MNTKHWIHLIVAVCCLGLVLGCATSGSGKTAAKAAPGADEKTAITKTLGDWSSALKSKNIESIMAFYSDAFQDGEGRDKAGIKDLIQGAISAGYLDGAKIDLASAQVTVTGDQATVAPVSLSGDMGAISLSVSLKKESGSWHIVSSHQA